MSSEQWEPIQDLPANWQQLASSELESLASIWKDQAGRLYQTQALVEFNERLRREWAIETGIIENLYSIDRGVTQMLIERGIEASLIPHGATDRPAELVVPILHDHEEALEGIFDFVAQRQQLSNSYIKQLHQLFTRHQETARGVNGLGRRTEIDLIRGDWKKWPNNPTRPDGSVHYYAPPEQVVSEMDRLMELHNAHSVAGVPPDVEAAWLHHRFSQIHPFQDGNGRVARALASLIFLRAGWFPLVVHRDIRSEYIDALEAADRGDLSSLVNSFVRVQKKSFLHALSISEDVLRDRESMQQVIQAAIDRLRTRQVQERAAQTRDLSQLSQQLEQIAFDHFLSVAETLDAELRMINYRYGALAERSDAGTQHYFNRQIIETAKRFDYYADMRTYAAWVRLKIRETRQAELILSFHSLGVEFLGIMAVSAFMEYRDRSEDNEVNLQGPYPLSDEIFQFSFKEATSIVKERFEQWLNNIVLIGLDQWRRQL
ncbi:MAG: Fic family protein [Chloroflexi bacterium]|nr:Fic family protein [Chloroflexota bacterium]